MAAFVNPKQQSSKANVKITSALCAVWCTLLGGFLYLSLKLNFPIDIITQPLLGVEVLASVIVLVHIGIVALSSARGRLNLKPKNGVKCVCGAVAACFIFHMIAVLFGAPALESSRETFHFAMLMTCLAVVPACCVLGADGEKWTNVYALGRPALGKETAVCITSISSVAGAWLGAVPIPLDWDRPWQVWPVSCVLGALFGYCLGLMMTAGYLLLKHRQLCKNKLT